MQIALAIPGLDSDAIELELLRAGHRITWRATSADALIEHLADVVPDVVLVADNPDVATADVIGACDLLGVRTCLVRADDAASASARLLGVHDILRAVPGSPLDLSVLLPAFDAFDGGIAEADGAHPGFTGGARSSAPSATERADAPPRAREGDDRSGSTARSAPPHRIDPAAPTTPSEGGRRRDGDAPVAGPRRRWPWSRRGDSDATPAPSSEPRLPSPVDRPSAVSEPRSTSGRALVPEPVTGATATLVEDAAPVTPLSTPPRQRVIAVWGPAGAPGRTTIAITLAAELASRGLRVCLVDADTYGGTIAPALGLLDEAPGFAAACRLAGSDSLDDAELDRIALTYGGTASPFRVLTGIGRPHRWPELSRDRVARALEAARAWSDVVVVDTGFNLETDEEVSSDMLAPRRNAATIAALRAADEVVAVGAADPVGLARLLRTHADLLETITTDRVHVVANRVRASVLGIDPGGQVRQTLERFGGIADPVLISDDASAADVALLSARTVVDVAPRSALRGGVARLADRAGYAAAPSGRGRASRAGGGRGLLRRTG